MSTPPFTKQKRKQSRSLEENSTLSFAWQPKLTPPHPAYAFGFLVSAAPPGQYDTKEQLLLPKFRSSKAPAPVTPTTQGWEVYCGAHRLEWLRLHPFP